MKRICSAQSKPSFCYIQISQRKKLGWRLHYLMESGLLYHGLQEPWKTKREGWLVGQGAEASAILSLGSWVSFMPSGTENTQFSTPVYDDRGPFAAIRTSSPASLFWIVRDAKCVCWWQRCLGLGEKKERKKIKHNMALWISCDRFFLLQLSKAIYIRLISKVLVIGGY